MNPAASTGRAESRRRSVLQGGPCLQQQAAPRCVRLPALRPPLGAAQLPPPPGGLLAEKGTAEGCPTWHEGKESCRRWFGGNKFVPQPGESLR